MYCINCGNNIVESAKFCPACGALVAGGQRDLLLDQSRAEPLTEPFAKPQAEPQAESFVLPQAEPQVESFAKSQAVPPFEQSLYQQPAPQPQSQQQPAPSQPQQQPVQPPLYQQQPQPQPQQQQPQPLYQQPSQPQPQKGTPVILVAVITAMLVIIGCIGGIFIIRALDKDSPPPVDISDSSTTNDDNSANALGGDQNDATSTTQTIEDGATESSTRNADDFDDDGFKLPDGTTTADTSTTDSATTEQQPDVDSTTGMTTGETDENALLPFVSYSYIDKKPEAIIEFSTVDSIFPSNYRSLDSMAIFAGYCDYGDLDVLIEVEVPGFTQKYRQKVTLGRQVTKLRIVPPLVTGTLDLSSEKTAQLVYSVAEVDSGKLLVAESKNIKLYSKYDIIWGDQENWDAYTDNILAWMTPDVPEITSLKRDAIDYLSYISDGELEGILGYQDYNYFDHYYLNTWAQAVAIQGAMSDIVQVRYNNSWFSMDAQQRVKLPADTLSSRSGLCVETSLVMASALKSTGMHVMLIFPPGHTQVAVEAWPGSGDYYLIETTALPMAQDTDTWSNVVHFLTKDEWSDYLSGEGEFTLGSCYVLDCDLGEKLGIRAISN